MNAIISERGVGRNIDPLIQFKNSKNYLFTIGINSYNPESGFPNLGCAINDVMSLSSLLLDKFNFENANFFSLTNEHASRTEILFKLQEIRGKIENDDNLIIFYAGHGWFNDGQGYIVPYDAKKGVEATLISNNELINEISRINNLHTVLILDSCHAGSFAKKLRGEYNNRAYSLKSRYLFASGRSNEKVLDGELNSPFTDAICRYLKSNNNSQIPAYDLFDYVKKTIPEQYTQTPLAEPLNVIGHENGEFIFVAKESDTTTWEKILSEKDYDKVSSFISNYPNSTIIDKAKDFKKNYETEKLNWENLLVETNKKFREFAIEYLSIEKIYDKQNIIKVFSDLISKIDLERNEYSFWSECETSLDSNKINEYKTNYALNGKFLNKADEILLEISKKKEREMYFTQIENKIGKNKDSMIKISLAKDFLVKYPIGRDSDKMKKIIDDVEWFLDIEKYRNYKELLEYLGDIYMVQMRGQAKKLKNEIEINQIYEREKEEFDKIVSIQDYTQLINFMTNDIGDNVYNQAILVKEEYDEKIKQELNNLIILKSPTKILTFIDKYKNTDWEIKGNLEYDSLDDIIFNESIEINSLEDLKYYIDTFPNGRHVKEAEHMIMNFHTVFKNDEESIVLDDKLEKKDIVDINEYEVSETLNDELENTSLLDNKPEEIIELDNESEKVIVSDNVPEKVVVSNNESEKTIEFEEKPQIELKLNNNNENSDTLLEVLRLFTNLKYPKQETRVETNLFETNLASQALTNFDINLCEIYLGKYPQGEYWNLIMERKVFLKNKERNNKLRLFGSLILFFIVFSLIILLYVKY